MELTDQFTRVFQCDSRFANPNVFNEFIGVLQFQFGSVCNQCKPIQPSGNVHYRSFHFQKVNVCLVYLPVFRPKPHYVFFVFELNGLTIERIQNFLCL